MSSEIIPCPSCRHTVRVPDSLFGQPVRCPECKAYFTAPIRDAKGKLGEPLILENPRLLTLESRPDGTAPTVHRGTLRLPGMALLLVGICGMIVNGFVAAAMTIRKAELIDAVKKSIEDPNNNAQKIAGRKLTADDVKEENFDDLRNAAAAFLVVCLVVCAGAAAILLNRCYPLALVGSGVAVINIGFCCCLAGAPVGIWCLIKLLDPEVRPIFRR